MRNSAGCAMPKRQVPCSRCKAPILRATHFKTSRCDGCQKHRNRTKAYAHLARIRRQARRYRIIVHVLGWEDDQFEDMLSEMKHSPMAFRTSAESRAVRFDLAVERHPSKFRGARNPHKNWKAA